MFCRDFMNQHLSGGPTDGASSHLISLDDFFMNIPCSIPVGPMRSNWEDLGGV